MAYLRPGQAVPTKGKGAKLGAKMAVFVDEYLVDLNASAATLRAGYKTTNPERLGTELLRHPNVKKAIDERMAERRERMEVTQDYVLTKLVAIVEETEKGNPQAALRGLELLGKHLGLYKERQEISGPDGKAIEMEQKTKRDAADFAGRMALLAKRSGANETPELPN